MQIYFFFLNSIHFVSLFSTVFVVICSQHTYFTAEERSAPKDFWILYRFVGFLAEGDQRESISPKGTIISNLLCQTVELQTLVA